MIFYIFFVSIVCCSHADKRAGAGLMDSLQVVHVGEIKELKKEVYDTSQINGDIEGKLTVSLEHVKIDGVLHLMKMRVHNNLSYSIVVMYKQDMPNEIFINKTDIISANSTNDIYVSFFFNQESLFSDEDIPTPKTLGMVYISKIKLIPNDLNALESVDFVELMNNPEKYIDQFVTVNGWLRFDNRTLGFCEDDSSMLTTESNYLPVEKEGLPGSPVEFRVCASVTGLYTSDFGLIDVHGGGVLSHISTVSLFPKESGRGDKKRGHRAKLSPVP